MISWMQKHNKYLVITIWVATIAFIGAGFVGWGSVSFGSKASSIAKVGDVTITKNKYSFNYNNLYNQYAQKLGNKFDRKVAKEMGLGKEVYRSLVTQALLLNLAKEYGIIATDEEVGKEIVSYQAFKGANGEFDKSIYENFLRARGFKAQDFEGILKDEIVIRKLFKLIDVKPLDFEKEVMKSTFNIADKIKYAVLKQDDINVTVTDNEIKKYWEKNKLNYLTKTKYNLDLLWTNTNDVNYTDADIEAYYKKNSFNYLDKDGKIKDFKDVKELVIKDYKLEKSKTKAAIGRSRFKKGKIKATESVVLNIDSNLTKDVWKALKEAKEGDFLKPKVLNDKYVTIHIVKIEQPKEMSYKEAKELAKVDLIADLKKKKVNKLADNMLKDSSKFTIEPKELITLSKFNVLPGLTPQDSLKFTRAIFASSKKVDKVALNNSIVVYKVVEQKLLDSNNTTNSNLDNEIKSIKSAELTNNLIYNLSKKYKVESYVKDFK